MIADEQLARCLEMIDEADGLLVTAGAGLGVDSGLPDFRGPQGLWRHYPGLAADRLSFEEIASPASFRRDPHQAWGFYGHRLQLYRDTSPHAGFAMLDEIGATRAHGSFVFTSNVDGQFHKAGFAAERICEIHGSIHFLQCVTPRCASSIWAADGFLPAVDVHACRLLNALPQCPRCGALARPNILMFGDGDWLEARTAAQYHALAAWLDRVQRPLVIEIGAGTSVPSVRRMSDQFERLIRINPDAPAVRSRAAVSLAMGGLAALSCIHAAWQGAAG